MGENRNVAGKQIIWLFNKKKYLSVIRGMKDSIVRLEKFLNLEKRATNDNWQTVTMKEYYMLSLYNYVLGTIDRLINLSSRYYSFIDQENALPSKSCVPTYSTQLLHYRTKMRIQSIWAQANKGLILNSLTLTFKIKSLAK